MLFAEPGGYEVLSEMKLFFCRTMQTAKKQHNLPLQGAQTESEVWIDFEYGLRRMRVEETSER
jgi:hypothetical protein